MTEMTKPGAAGWIEHSGPDNAAAKAFYADVTGWAIAGMPMKDGTSYSGIMVGDQPIGGFSPKPEEKGTWVVYITVPDVDGSVARAKSAGAQVLSGPVDVPGVGRSAMLLDPQGARFALITYESMQD